MQIVEAKSPRDLSRFIRIPRELYSGIAGYQPPVDLERKLLLHPKWAPFATHGEVALFIAEDGNGRPLGRISAQFDRLTPPERAGTGHFGCLDAVDDPRVVAALIATARRWHAERGRHRIEGPFTYSINEEAGVQIEGQQHGDMVLMPWHPPYLGALVEQAGLAPVKDLLAYSISSTVAQRWTGARVARLSQQSRVTVRHLNLWKLGAEAAIMTELFNASWKDNWGFIPLATAELATLLQIARPVMKASYGIILEMDGKPVAFAFALPNAYELIRGFGGRLLPFNWARLIWRLMTHTYRTGRVTLLGVHADLRDTLLGASLPIVAIANLISANPVDGEIEMGWILDDNVRMSRIIENAGGRISKRYRLYGDAPAEGIAE
ncbi:MAG: dATP pyrophosphohydrolase [Phreatobacter sp.]|uniref:hypothetical protein n=1 Tax=Phreatobacter sp. TaxID=1966341 RepID=UPI001A36E8A8|nr:hypothetical protein [Phreatobacter sp.]MBL8569042.1 dATP pyrophosphohydrolase [Phreatobacter sp.]